MTDSKRRRLWGVLVIGTIALLNLATEYLGTHDAVRFVSKGISLLLGLPLLVAGSSALFRWASRKRLRAPIPLFIGAGLAVVRFK